MTTDSMVMARCSGQCELCSSTTALTVYDVRPNSGQSVDTSVALCSVCYPQVDKIAPLDAKHWYCLNESMWSEVAAVQVLAYRVLKNLGDEGFARDLLEQLYLDDDTKQWAEAGAAATDDQAVVTVDSNGTPLAAGDTVTLIKDLVVKGANFTAKRGTTVKNIILTDDPKHIEGRVNGTRIVLVAAFLKKA